jgi:hypothetical protein
MEGFSGLGFVWPCIAKHAVSSRAEQENLENLDIQRKYIREKK